MSLSASTTDGSSTLRCARHPGTQTVLRCGRCETPICPKCMVSTPVGARCRSCAQIKRMVLLLKPVEMARSAAYGVGVAGVGFVIALILPSFGPFLQLLIYGAVGYAAGEAVSTGANRKRAPELGPIAVACLFLGYELGPVLFGLVLGEPFGPRLLLGPILALRSSIMIDVGLLIAGVLAWTRVR